MSAPTRAQPLTVPLNGGERVIVAEHDGEVEAAFYRPRREGEDKGLPPTLRFTWRRPTLEAVLDAVMFKGDSDNHASAVATYIRSLPRGRDLP